MIDIVTAPFWAAASLVQFLPGDGAWTLKPSPDFSSETAMLR
jgi:hypothetical protein